MELKGLSKGQIWTVPSNGGKDSSHYQKTRPYVICQKVLHGLNYVFMAPMGDDNGKLYPFQQRYNHKKPSKIHYENSRVVSVSSLIEYEGSLSDDAIKEMETCQIYLFDLDNITFTDITSIEVQDIGNAEVKVMINYPRKEKIVTFSKEDFYKDCVGFLNSIREKESLESFLSTFRGLQFLRKRGKIDCLNTY